MRLAPRILLLVVPAASVLVVAIGAIATSVIEERLVAQVTNELRREAEFGALQIETTLRGLHREMRAVAANDLLVRLALKDEVQLFAQLSRVLTGPLAFIRGSGGIGGSTHQRIDLSSQLVCAGI